MTADHGGGGFSDYQHGDYSELDRKIVLILSGDNLKPGHIAADCGTKVSHMDVFPSVFEYLRLPIQDSWKLDGISRLEWYPTSD